MGFDQKSRLPRHCYRLGGGRYHRRRGRICWRRHYQHEHGPGEHPVLKRGRLSPGGSSRDNEQRQALPSNWPEWHGTGQPPATCAMLDGGTTELSQRLGHPAPEMTWQSRSCCRSAGTPIWSGGRSAQVSNPDSHTMVSAGFFHLTATLWYQNTGTSSAAQLLLNRVLRERRTRVTSGASGNPAVLQTWRIQSGPYGPPANEAHHSGNFQA